MVGGDQFQVAAADPVPVIHTLVARIRAGRSGGVHRHVELSTHDGSQAGGGRETHSGISEGSWACKSQNPSSVNLFWGLLYTPYTRAMEARGLWVSVSDAVPTREHGDHLQERRVRSAFPGTATVSNVVPLQSWSPASHPELRRAPVKYGSW